MHKIIGRINWPKNYWPIFNWPKRVARLSEENITEEIGITLKQLKIVLTEKLETLTKLDDEILELIKEEEIEDEIAESGDFRASIHEAIIKIDNAF